jgi:putative addiction module component (TIGR02574 family)
MDPPNGGALMPPTIKELGIDQLSLEDRIALVQEIWDSIAAEVEQAPLTEAQRHELERRRVDSLARPDAVTPWEEIKTAAERKARSRGE